MQETCCERAAQVGLKPCVCVCVCVRAFVRACVRVRAYVCLRVRVWHVSIHNYIYMSGLYIRSTGSIVLCMGVCIRSIGSIVLYIWCVYYINSIHI